MFLIITSWLNKHNVLLFFQRRIVCEDSVDFPVKAMLLPRLTPHTKPPISMTSRRPQPMTFDPRKRIPWDLERPLVAALCGRWTTGSRNCWEKKKKKGRRMVMMLTVMMMRSVTMTSCHGMWLSCISSTEPEWPTTTFIPRSYRKKGSRSTLT